MADEDVGHDTRWITEEQEVKDLAEWLRPLINTSAILRLDNDCFSVINGAIVEIWKEPAAVGKEAQDDQDDRQDAMWMDSPDLMPHQLLAALARLLGMKAEHC